MGRWSRNGGNRMRGALGGLTMVVGGGGCAGGVEQVEMRGGNGVFCCYWVLDQGFPGGLVR